jgi:hypothetical protein
MKRKGDSESPCLRLGSRLNKPKGLPLIRMENDGEMMQIRIQFIQVE